VQRGSDKPTTPFITPKPKVTGTTLGKPVIANRLHREKLITHDPALGKRRIRKPG
jgi:hypothetical protein